MTTKLLTIKFQGGSGTGNRNRKPEPSEPYFPEPKAEPEPPEPFSWNRNRNRSFLLNSTETQKKTFLQGNRQNRKPEPLEPFPSQAVTEPNRTGASLKKFFQTLGDDKRPESRGFKKSAEIRHGPAAPLWLHQKYSKTSALGAFVLLKRGVTELW